MVEFVYFHFFNHLIGVFNSFGYINEQFFHFTLGFKPFLLCIAQAIFIVNIFGGANTNQTVMRSGIFLINKMNIIGGHHF